MKKRVPGIIIFFLLALFLFSLVFSFALAQDRKLEVEYPEVFGVKPETVKTLLPEYAKYIFNFSVAIFGLVVFGVLIWAGFLYLTSVGDPAKRTDAKERIFSAFLGLLVLLLSYIILTTINPQLVMFKVPLLTRPEMCQTSAQCAPGFECIKKECVRKKCATDAECPKGLFCDEETKVCIAKRETTLISLEIPLGQIIENGVWKKENIEATKKVLDDFETFLTEDIAVNPTFNRISDLNKYLKTLTEDCRCDKLTPVCGQPQNFGGEAGCKGDPCESSREKMEKIREINRAKIEKLKEFNKKIEKRAKLFKREENKFVALQEKMNDCIERNGELLTRNEYLARVEFYEEQGWKTVVIPTIDIPSKGDPFTFYCATGGTMFDIPYRIPAELPADLTPKEMPTEATEVEQLSCPAEIPIGEILDDLGTSAYLTSSDLQELMTNIDILIEKITNLDGSVSQCNDTNCDIACSGQPNPCYMRVCGCIPVCPGDPPFPNPCYPNPLGPTPSCLIPKLQETGICFGKNLDAPYHGYPCPRDEIEELVGSVEKPKEKPGKIKLFEDEIFSAIKRIRESFADASYTITDAENPIRFDIVKQATSLCFSQKSEEITWLLLDCAMALGNYGPDGSVITNCSPGNFFCCTSSEELAKAPPFPSAVESSRPSTFYQTAPGVVFPPSKYGKNKVPYFSQNRPALWSGDRLGNCPSRIEGAGCKLTSIAMVLKYYGVNTDPGELNRWMRKNNLIGGGCLMGYPYGATAKAFGVKLAQTFWSNSAIVSALKTGKHPIVVGFVGGVAVTGSKGQHWIVLTGIDENYVYKNDPIYKRGIRGIPIETFLRTKGLKRGEFLTK